MFNPYEYTVTKTNAYSEMDTNGKNTPTYKYNHAGPQSLKLALILNNNET